MPYDEMKSGYAYAMTPRELKMLLAKSSVVEARKDKRPNRGPITDNDIKFLKNAMEAPDVGMFLRLV
jgi:hypothetical protein